MPTIAWIVAAFISGISVVLPLGSWLYLSTAIGVDFETLLLVIFLSAAITSGSFWVLTSRLHYSKQKLHPGLIFLIDGKTRIANPNITYDKGISLLKPEFISQQRWLLQKIHDLFSQINIPYWVTGGTLIGLYRDKMMLPWDDDIDVATTWNHRKYLFSNEFGQHCTENELEAFILRGSSSSYANRVGGAVRIRKQGNVAPVADIFFHAHLLEDDKVFKLDGWKQSNLKLSKKEIWNKDWIHPIQTQVIDGIKVPLPNNPRKCLIQQYGDDVMQRAKKRSLLLSHWTQYSQPVFSIIWKRLS